MNAAQQIHIHLGVPLKDSGKQAHGNKNASATKAGPGRVRQLGEPGNRITKARPMRAYKALMAAWAARRVTKAPGRRTKLRDEHGAYTLVGSAYVIEGASPSKREHVTAAGEGNGESFYGARRIWLAGISAQRGY